MKYNKVRGILRAKQGSQIPKLYTGNLLELLALQCPTVKGNFAPNPQVDATDSQLPTNTVIDSLRLPLVPLVKEPDFSDWKGSTNARDSLRVLNRHNVNSYLPKTLEAPQTKQPTGWLKFGKKMGQVGTGLAEGFGNFITDNAEGIMSAGKVIALNSIDIQGDNFSKFSNTMSTIKGVADNFGPMGKAVGAVAGAIDVWGNVINALGAKKLLKFSVDKEVQERVGGAYAGSYTDINKAGDLAGKKVGLFGNARGKNRFIDEQRRVQSKIASIDATNLNMLAMAGNDLNYLNYQMQSNGGYDLMYMGMRAKQGGKLLDKINLIKSCKFNLRINVDTKQIEEFKEGGSLPELSKETYEWEPIIEDLWEPIIEIPEFLEGGKLDLQSIYDYYKDYDLAGINLMYDNSARTEGNTIYVNSNESAIHELWHLLSLNKPNERYKEFYDNLNDNRITELGGDLNFVKRFEEDPGHFYHPSELEARVKAAKYMSKGLNYTEEFFLDARSTDENKWGDNMRDLLHMFNNKNLVKIFNLKKGGTIKEELETPEIEETSLKNLIPEGALHKNKHHMEHTEGLTLKGIPVIDNDGEQQAEIELDEIIFTLEVTKKLEELYKEGTDEAAIEAGKLLVKEILFNTDDRTGLIAKCLEGGKL